MKLLAIDTSAGHCAACLYDSASDEAHTSIEEIGTGHAERLMGQIAQVLEEADATYQDLNRIAVCTGPGSFTGVRVGVSAARGLALALSVPALGVTALEAIAEDARPLAGGRPIAAVIDARRDQLYVQCFDAAGTPDDDPRIIATEDIDTLCRDIAVLAGNGAAGRSGALLDTAASGDIVTIARLGASRAPGGAPTPLYLRAADAKPQAGFALPRAEPA